MAIIVSKNGKNAVKIEKSSFRLEDQLQQYIYNNPETIPLYDIKEDIRLLVLAREFATNSGPIDALGIDKEGELYLIETKLYKNSDKRTVVAQVLDYGAALWSHFRDFDDFVNQVNIHIQKDFKQTLRERINDFFGLPEEEIQVLLDNLRNNLKGGNFKFVVLMDKLYDKLKDLIIFLNNNSEFTIYAVELEYYRHQDFEIIIPKLFGAEIKKDLGKSSPKIIPDDKAFLQAYQDKPEQEKLKELLQLFNELKNGDKKIANVTVRKTPRYLNFYVSLDKGEKLTVSLSINPDYEGGGLQFWGPKKYVRKVKSLARKQLPGIKILPELKTQYGKLAKLPLKNYSRSSFEQFLKKCGLG